MFVSAKKYERALDKINDLMAANDALLAELNRLVIQNAGLQEQAEANDEVIANLRAHIPSRDPVTGRFVKAVRQ